MPVSIAVPLIRESTRKPVKSGARLKDLADVRVRYAGSSTAAAFSPGVGEKPDGTDAQ